jgi:hypothetical protein
MDTPETEAAVIASNGQWSYLLKATCERLERERNEARAERDILRFDAQREAEHHDKLVKELENLYDKLKSQGS